MASFPQWWMPSSKVSYELFRFLWQLLLWNLIHFNALIWHLKNRVRRSLLCNFNILWLLYYQFLLPCFNLLLALIKVERLEFHLKVFRFPYLHLLRQTIIECNNLIVFDLREVFLVKLMKELADYRYVSPLDDEVNHWTIVLKKRNWALEVATLFKHLFDSWNNSK